MKNRHNEGFTLVELLVSIALLSAIVLPTCTSLVLSYRLNAKAEQMMQAQLAVSSAVETLMAEGIDGGRAKTILDNGGTDYDFAWEDGGFSETDDYPDVKITIAVEAGNDAYYAVTVSDNAELVTVTTHIRVAKGGGQS